MYPASALWFFGAAILCLCRASFVGQADYIITLRSHSRTDKAYAALLARHDLTPKFGDLLHGMTPVRLPLGVSPSTAAKALQMDAAVLRVEPDAVIQAAGAPDDPRFGEQWGLYNARFRGSDIHAQAAWRLETGDRRIVVAIIDTGIDYLHPDLAANIWRNPDEAPHNGRDDDQNGYVDDVHGWSFADDNADPMDRQFHGTHVGGIVGAVAGNGLGVAGVMHRVSLMAVKGLGDGGYGFTSDLIAAIYYAVDNGARVINASWGSGGFSHAMEDALAYARDHGVIVVAAAGNWKRNNDVDPFYPASYPLDNIVSVAASDSVDGLTHFTHYGPTTVDIAAPGIEITSTAPGGRYLRTAGTSQAAPHVAGVIGLMISFAPHLAYREYTDIVLSSARRVPQFRNMVVADGVVDAHAALRDLAPNNRAVQAAALRERGRRSSK
jgi:subtilisin family serine protease